MRRTILVGFVTVLVSLLVNGLVTLAAIDRLEQTILDSNKATESVVMTYEELEPEQEVVIVTREIYEDGTVVFEYGDVYDESYFYVVINQEQDVYDYYWPAMCEDCDQPLVYNSLAELNESITCHIDQEWPNATFVTVSR